MAGEPKVSLFINVPQEQGIADSIIDQLQASLEFRQKGYHIVTSLEIIDNMPIGTKIRQYWYDTLGQCKYVFILDHPELQDETYSSQLIEGAIFEHKAVPVVTETNQGSFSLGLINIIALNPTDIPISFSSSINQLIKHLTSY